MILSSKLPPFPEDWKNPIIKRHARADPKNYRPISLLPLVSKTVEKSIHILTEDYLSKKKLI